MSDFLCESTVLNCVILGSVLINWLHVGTAIFANGQCHLPEDCVEPAAFREHLLCTGHVRANFHDFQACKTNCSETREEHASAMPVILEFDDQLMGLGLVSG
jgi:hypothetical protein